MSPSIDFPAVPTPVVARRETRVLTSSTLARLGFFAVLLACSLAVFLFGPGYYDLFISNGSIVYNAGLAVGFLVIALLLKRSPAYSRYWLVAYAFFIASVVNLVSTVLGSNPSRFVHLFGSDADPNKQVALGKLYETLLITGTIIVLTLASGANLKSISLCVGNLNWRWGVGIGALFVINYFTSVLIFFGNGYQPAKLLSAAIWGFVFAFSNSLLEELWVRGLFLKKLAPLVGMIGSLLLTTITFAAMHFISVAYFPASVVPIFVINTFTLGLACGILMIKTDSIWGAYLLHAAADLFLFIATLAAH